MRKPENEYDHLHEYAEMRPAFDSEPSGASRGMIIGGITIAGCCVALALIRLVLVR